MSASQKERDFKLSIIIVNFNSGELLKNCLRSICCQIEVDFEVIIYDNASSDTSVSSLTDDSRVSIIQGTENLGFARANNLAVEHSSGSFLHFLNPDIEVDQRLNDLYHEISDDRRSAVWVTSLLDTQGKYLDNKMMIPRIKNLYYWLIDSPKVRYWSLGASLVVERGAFTRVGGWPEDYFMYAEDLDFFYTCHLTGIPVIFSTVPVLHIGGGVTHKIWNPEQRATIIERSFKAFYRKYGAIGEYYLVRPVQLIYMLFHDRKQFALYTRVFIRNLKN